MNTMSGIFLKNTMINGNFRLKCFWIVEILASQKKALPENYGNYKNKSKIRLKSTAVYNGTFFWISK